MEIRLDSLHYRFDDELLCEGIRDLDGGSLRVRLVCECLAGEACSTNAVSSCPSPDKVDEVTWVPGFAEDELVLSSETDARDINETVSLEGRVELHLSADCRNANAVAVVCYSPDDVVEEPAGVKTLD